MMRFLMEICVPLEICCLAHVVYVYATGIYVCDNCRPAAFMSAPLCSGTDTNNKFGIYTNMHILKKSRCPLGTLLEGQRLVMADYAKKIIWLC